LRGFIGELSNVNDVSIFGLGKSEKVRDKLTEVLYYLPEYAVSTLQVAMEAKGSESTAIEKIEDTINITQNMIDLIGDGVPGETKQQIAYRKLKALRDSRQIFTVETPWEYLDNMAIESLVFKQGAETKMITDISITLKQIRLAQVLVVKRASDRVGNQKSAAKNKGKVSTQSITDIGDVAAGQLKDMLGNIILTGVSSAEAQ
jgi:hypothetical protein